MNKKYRILAFLLALLLCVSGCADQSIWAELSSDSTSGAETSGSALPAAAGQAADDEPPDEPDPEALVYASLYEDVTEEETEKTVLTIGTLHQKGELESLVSKFNAASEDYTAQIELYEDTAVLNTRILAGDGPDVLLLEDGNYLSYVTNDILLDVGEILDAAEDYESVLRNDIRTCFSDKVAVASYYFTCMSAPEYVLNGKTSWTFSEFMEIAADTNCFEKNEKEVCLALYCSSNLSSFLDEANHTCNFECDEFYSALEFVNQFLSDSSQMVSDGKASDIEFLDISSVSQLDNTFYEETFWGGSPSTYLGFPSDTDSGLHVSPNLIFGIPYSAQQPDGARAFLSYALSEEYQSQLGYALPVLHSVLMDSVTEFFSTGEYADDPDIAETMAAKMTNMLNRTTAVAYTDSSIYEIVSEEAAGYFSGDKTAEETAHLIQSRVQIYLSEQS